MRRAADHGGVAGLVRRRYEARETAALQPVPQLVVVGEDEDRGGDVAGGGQVLRGPQGVGHDLRGGVVTEAEAAADDLALALKAADAQVHRHVRPGTGAEELHAQRRDV